MSHENVFVKFFNILMADLSSVGGGVGVALSLLNKQLLKNI